MNEPRLRKLVKKRGALALLEDLRAIFEENAKEVGKVGKKCKTRIFRDQAFSTSSEWWELERGLRELLGRYRHARPTDRHVERV